MPGDPDQPRPVLPYRGFDLPARNFSRTRMIAGCWLCGVMIFANLLFCVLAVQGYRHAASLPAQRVTAIQKVERTLVRTARGFDKTYASRGALAGALITSGIRFVFLATLALLLWKALREDVIALGRLRLACYGLILVAPVTLVAWFLFTQNLSKVRQSFGLLGDFLGMWSNSYALIIIGVSCSTAMAAALLRYFRADVE